MSAYLLVWKCNVYPPTPRKVSVLHSNRNVLDGPPAFPAAEPVHRVLIFGCFSDVDIFLCFCFRSAGTDLTKDTPETQVPMGSACPLPWCKYSLRGWFGAAASHDCGRTQPALGAGEASCRRPGHPSPAASRGQSAWPATARLPGPVRQKPLWLRGSPCWPPAASVVGPGASSLATWSALSRLEDDGSCLSPALPGAPGGAGPHRVLALGALYFLFSARGRVVVVKVEMTEEGESHEHAAVHRPHARLGLSPAWWSLLVQSRARLSWAVRAGQPRTEPQSERVSRVGAAHGSGRAPSQPL